MSELRRRLDRIERERRIRLAIRYDVSDVPLDDEGGPSGETHDRPMTIDEWAARHVTEH